MSLAVITMPVPPSTPELQVSIQEIWSHVEKDANPADFARAFFDSAVAERWNAVAELTGGCLPEFGIADASDDTIAGKAGHIAGSALDIALIAAITKAPLGRALSATGLEGTVTGAALSLGAVGAAYGGLFTPSARGDSLLSGRLKNSTLDFATFSVLGGAGKALEVVPGFTARSLAGTIKLNAAAGGIAGLANVQASAMLHGRLVERPLDYLKGATNYAALGAAFAAFDGAMRPATGTSSVETVPEVKPVLEPETAPAKAVEPLNEINMLGKPGPGITAQMIDAAQKVATQTGDTVVFFGSRQTGFTQRSVDAGDPHPFNRESDLDLGMTSPEALFRSHENETWKQIPLVEHGPVGIFSEEQALARGFLVIRPAKVEAKTELSLR